MQGHVSFTLQQLKGVPADVLSGYTKRTEGGQEVYDISFQFQDILPLVFRPLFYRCPHKLTSSWGS